MTTEELLMKYENQWVFLSKEQIDYMLDEILPPLPQQEISDEEIEKEIRNRYMHPTQDYAWRDACKWYKEKLKCKGNGNK